MHLTDCFNPCFVAVLDIIGPHHEASDLAAGAGKADTVDKPVNAARRVCQEKLDRAVESAASFYETRTLMLARRLVTAWIDERLGSDPWPGRDAWLARPLQCDWNEGRHSGEWFFTTAGSLTQGKQDHDEVARLALRCLSLGLEGPYFDNPAELLRLRRDLALRFDLTVPVSPFPSFVETAGAPVDATRRGLWAVPFILAAIITLAALLGENALNRRLETILDGPAAAATAPEGTPSS
ncbi:MAG: DotU family type IV/VI secretion system protein [Planctomycetaceae bacterium]|nr:DotU family type IV/VI secretion system protein [Planctomycetaceae bacterium]